MSAITRTGTLPDSANKSDFYGIIDSATVGAIVNDDIDAAAGIVDTKLAQITTASKVSGAAITGLASLPAGAGVIPAANLTAIASQAEAEAGTENTKSMTPLRTSQAIAALAEAGVSVYTGSLTRDLSAASGDVVYNPVGLNFTPKAIFAFGTKDGSTLAPLSLGFATATLGAAVQTYTTSGSVQANASRLCTLYIDGSNAQGLDIASFGSGTFTGTWTKTGTPTGTATVVYFLIG